MAYNYIAFSAAGRIMAEFLCDIIMDHFRVSVEHLIYMRSLDIYKHALVF